MAAGKKKRSSGAAPSLTKAQKRNVYNIVGTSLVVVFAALVLYATVFAGARRPSASQTRQMDRQRETAGRSQSECPTRPGQEWEYDEATRCYFDPSPGHGHWHVGRPPALSERARLMSGAASPEPAAPAPAAETPASPLDSEP